MTILEWLQYRTNYTVQIQQFVIRARYPCFVVLPYRFAKRNVNSMPYQRFFLDYWHSDAHKDPKRSAPDEPMLVMLNIPKQEMMSLKLRSPDVIRGSWVDLES